MRISGCYKYNKAIKVTPDNIVLLENNILKYCDKIEYYCSTISGNEIQFQSFDELINYDNFRKRKIESLNMLCSKGHNRIIRLSFYIDTGFFFNYRQTSECIYEFCSLDEEVLFVEMLKDGFKKMTTDYWLVGKFSVWLAILFSSGIISIINLLNGTFSNVNVDIATWLTLGTVTVMLLYLVRLFDKKVLLKIFNPLVFYWGEEVNVDKKNKNLRSNILWGIIIAIIIGVISTIVVKLLGL